MDTQLITNIVLILVVVAAGYDRYKSGNSNAAKETISILKEALAAKDIKLVEQKASHDTAMATLRAEFQTMKAQLEHMKETNLILTNTVTGKETLLAITEVLKPIPALFVPGGFIEQVMINQQKALKDLSELREALEKSPAIDGPKNHRFKERSQTVISSTL